MKPKLKYVFFFLLVLFAYESANSQIITTRNFLGEYLAGNNFVIFKSKIYSHRYVRNEVSIIYVNIDTLMNYMMVPMIHTIVRSSAEEENIDTIFRIDQKQMDEIVRCINNIIQKKTLREDNDNKYLASGAYNELKIFIPNSGGVIYRDGKRLEPKEELFFEFSDRMSGYSLVNKLIRMQ